MTFTERDTAFMQMALHEAEASLASGDFPVGAVLVVDGSPVGKARNSIKAKKDWGSHAEENLFRQHSSLIKESIKDRGQEAVLYTTLEPCLMCLGSAVLHRIPKIVYGCPDPFTGATSLAKDSLPSAYQGMWPEVCGGLLKEPAFDLVVNFMASQNTEKWNKALKMYDVMRKQWNT